MKVSVIICCYTMERLKDTHEALASVLAQTLEPYEVIVAVDHNRELLRRLHAEVPPELTRVKLVLNEGARGLSETRNVGIRAAEGDIVAFIDDDAVAEKEWLGNLTSHFDDKRVVAVGGRAIPAWLNGRRPSWFPDELDWIIGCTYKGLPLSENEARNVPGCNMAFQKDIFNEAGFWENRIGSVGQSFKGGEEAEFCLRIKSKIPGRIILWEPTAIIHHKVPVLRASLRWVVKNSFDQGFCKAKVKKFSQSTLERPLSAEVSYLYYLLLKAIPERFKGFWRRGNLQQAGAILLSIAATGAGYLLGRARG